MKIDNRGQGKIAIVKIVSLFAAFFLWYGCGVGGGEGGGVGGGVGGGEEINVQDIPPPLGTSILFPTDNTSITRNVFSLKVAMDPEGNAITVWEQPDGNQNKVCTTRYVAGTGWGISTTIATQNHIAATSPQIAMDPNGNAIAVWLQTNEIGTHFIQNVVANRYVASIGWGTVTKISPDTSNIFDLQFAMDPKGNAMAVWKEGVGGGKIWFNRYAVSVGWGTASLVPTPSNAAYHPQVAVDSNGNAIVFWLQASQDQFMEWTLFANRYGPGTGWETPTTVSSAFLGLESDIRPRVALDGSGNALLVWKQVEYKIEGNTWTPTGKKIWFNRYAVGVGWDNAAPVPTSTVGTPTSVVLDPNGNSTVTYNHEGEPHTGRVFAIHYIVGAGWNDPSLLSIEYKTFGSSFPGSAQLILDPHGGVIAVWNERDYGYSLYTNRYVPGVGWGGPTPLITAVEANGNFSMAIDSDGNAITVYTHNNGTQTDVWANMTHF